MIPDYNKPIQSYQNKTTDKKLQERLSDLVFKQGKLIDIMNNYEPHYKEQWWLFRKNIYDVREYKCKDCKVVIDEGDRLIHYAQEHYEVKK